MRRVEIASYGGPEVLQLIDAEAPEAGPGQVLVRVRAAAVNPVDWFTRAGYLGALTADLPLPYVLGWDFAGEVLADAAGLHAGQRVAGMVPWFDYGTGTYAEVIAVDPSWLAPLPDELDWVSGAAVPLNALTGAQAVALAGISAGQRVLVTGASGAVGSAAVQRAVAAGAEVLALSSTGDESWVAGLGAKEVLGRQTLEELLVTLRDLAPEGLDAVVDAVPLGADLVGAVRDGGAFVTVLDSAVPAPERGIVGVKVDVRPSAPLLAELLTAVAQKRFVVRVAHALPLESVREAHEQAAAGGLRGKVVVTL